MAAVISPAVSFQRIPSLSSPSLTLLKITQFSPHFLPRPPFRKSIKNVRRLFVVFAAENNTGPEKDPNETEDDNNNGQEDLKRDGRPTFNLRWRDLFYPDPDNILALGLTGLLTWASVQVLWQLLFISLAILVAALKYSFIAALLLFILITLL